MPTPIRVLVVEDEEAFQERIKALLEAAGIEVFQAFSGWKCVELLDAHHFDAVVLDLNLPDTTGFSVLEDIRREGDNLVVVVVSAYADPDSARRAQQSGATLVLNKSFEEYVHLPETVIELVDEHRTQSPRRAAPRARAHTPPPIRTWLTPSLRAVFERLERSQHLAVQRMLKLARTANAHSDPILIEGRPGSDRARIGRYVYAALRPPRGPFVETSAARSTTRALFGDGTGQDGHVLRAIGGYLFIDHIEQLDSEGQRILNQSLMRQQSHAAELTPSRALAITPRSQLVDAVRLVAATTGSLAEATRQGRFDETLYQRLRSAEHIYIPPLCERQAEIATEFADLIEEAADAMGVAPPQLSPEAAACLQRHPFPGNEQELAAMATLACARHAGRVLTAADLFCGGA